MEKTSKKTPQAPTEPRQHLREAAVLERPERPSGVKRMKHVLASQDALLQVGCGCGLQRSLLTTLYEILQSEASGISLFKNFRFLCTPGEGWKEIMCGGVQSLDVPLPSTDCLEFLLNKPGTSKILHVRGEDQLRIPCPLWDPHAIGLFLGLMLRASLAPRT